MSEVNVGDTGTEIILECGVSIFSAFNAAILVEKPDGSTARWPASVTGMTSIVHVSEEGDFDQPGIYAVQAYVEMPGWKGRGTMGILEVSA